MVLGLLVSALVYKIRTKRLISESLLFGLGVYLIFLGLLIITKLVSFPSFLTFDYVLTPILYFSSVIILTAHPRFRHQDNWKLALYVAGTVLLIKVVIVLFAIQALLGIGVTV